MYTYTILCRQTQSTCADMVSTMLKQNMCLFLNKYIPIWVTCWSMRYVCLLVVHLSYYYRGNIASGNLCCCFWRPLLFPVAVWLLSLHFAASVASFCFHDSAPIPPLINCTC